MDGDHMGEHGKWVHGAKTLHVGGSGGGGGYVSGFELPRYLNMC
jgi:hypothetical protein